MASVVIVIGVLFFFLIAFTRFCLLGNSLSQYNRAKYQVFEIQPESDGIEQVNQLLIDTFVTPASGPESKSEKLADKRARLDALGGAREFDVHFISATVGGVEGEWSLASKRNNEQRILYIHGGAFTAGSAKSHRAVTANIALNTGCAVFAPNYRLMPEHKRLDGFEDCLDAYQAILDTGPEGREEADSIAIMGDSAGGNLTLCLAQEIRRKKWRQPNALVGFSSLIDSGLESPSIKNNRKTDLMLGPFVENFLKIPRFVYVWLYFFTTGIRPSDPRVSPIRGNLKRLPATLLQVSAHEVLLDDNVRYASKSQEMGGECELQIWQHMCHVWHVFDDFLPEAEQAVKLACRFLKEHGVGTR